MALFEDVLTEPQRDWLSSTRLPLRKAVFHRKDGASTALFQAVRCPPLGRRTAPVSPDHGVSTLVLNFDPMCCQTHLLNHHVACLVRSQMSQLTRPAARSSCNQATGFINGEGSAELTPPVPRAAANA